MVKKAQFRSAAKRAVTNIVKHGDTDIFPFPFENHVLHDRTDEVVDLIVEYNNDHESYLTRFSPQHINSLNPVSYSGFRWATQMDPIWNAHYLACVLALGKRIEEVRIPQDRDVIFSYRYKPNNKTGDLFDRSVGWYQFIEHSTKLAEDFEFVVACDISEFYPRLGHHRLENALKQIAGETPYPGRLIKFLSNFSNNRSFGLPIGGPASRMLSELTINQVDRLLWNQEVHFTRFVDDYHLFANSREEAYNHLVFLSEKLFVNQGLSLQKSKTRIMSRAEFISTNPLQEIDPVEELTKAPQDEAAALQRSRLLRFSLTFDPYSPTAEADYEELKAELVKFDIIGLLKSELTKSRVHIALSRKILAAIRFLESDIKDEAVLTIVNNTQILYPIFSSVLLMIDQIFTDLSQETQDEVVTNIRSMISTGSHVLRVEVHQAYAIRVLAHQNNADNVALLQQLFERTQSSMIRRDIILIMARWGEWYWLSDLRNRFRQLAGPERRAFIVASYKLTDEGNHWRGGITDELDPFEKLILSWAGEKSNLPNWEVPL